ncbi:MAG: hypothetical protein M3O20_10020 [Acidobacteriota bacterium]|nr:hypothetical protein [Acidobacteriota bacterium]
MNEAPLEQREIASRCSLCRDHEILFGRLQADRRIYMECTWLLEHSKPEEFEYTYQRAKDARNAFLKARKRLDAHIEEHGCGR